MLTFFFFFQTLSRLQNFLLMERGGGDFFLGAGREKSSFITNFSVSQENATVAFALYDYTHDCCCYYCCYYSKSIAANWPAATAAWRTGSSWGRPTWDRARSATTRKCRSSRSCRPKDLWQKIKSKINNRTNGGRAVWLDRTRRRRYPRSNHLLFPTCTRRHRSRLSTGGGGWLKK